MSNERSKGKDYKPLSSPDRPRVDAVQHSLKPARNSVAANTSIPAYTALGQAAPSEGRRARTIPSGDPKHSAEAESAAEGFGGTEETAENITAAPDRKTKKKHKDRDLLSRDRWLVRNGHTATYIGLFLFSIMVLFRPYEIVPGLGFLSATAFYLAVATLAIYLPSQLAAEGNLTMLSTEVKAILAMTFIAVLTIPIARNPGLAWGQFNDSFIKAVAIFIVLVNVVRTRKRLMGLMWLSFGIGIYLGFSALNMYMKGQFNVEEYRVGVDVGGMFGNPNEMALHLVMMTPLVIALGLASKSYLMRLVYFAMAGLFVLANMVTFSRGGFLGLIAVGMVLIWKLGRQYRLNVTIASIVVGVLLLVAAPGNYGLRMLSIFVPGLDPVGSSDQRWSLLERSLVVSARNPWGIGIGNFPIVGIRNLQSHNAFTQVSAELGILGLIAYLIFMISPFRKLGAIERTLFESKNLDWFYYLAIGLQASIIGYMVSSFFASVAYNWFIYYLIAYAVAFRRIYSIENGLADDAKPANSWDPTVRAAV